MTRPDPNSASVQALFARAVARLDRPAGERLRQAREQAVAVRDARAPGHGWLPAGALATAAIALALLVWQPLPTAPAPLQVDATAASDLPALEEDPELYAWLADAPVATSDESERPL